MSVLIKGIDQPENCHKCPCIQTFGAKFICGVTGDDINRLHICPMEKAPEPKKGKWISFDIGVFSNAGRECSNCGKRFELNITYPYCPMCGADMRED